MLEQQDSNLYCLLAEQELFQLSHVPDIKSKGEARIELAFLVL